MEKSIAVLVPCYNEAIAIGKVVADFKAALPTATIYVYDNNSTDDTFEVARVRTRYFQRNKNRVCRGHGGVACVPCFIFPKASWSVSNRSFPVLTVLRVSMTDASSAASYTSSSTGFSGRMHLMSTARTKRCTIDSSGGADSVFSIKFSLSWPTKRLLMAH